MRNRLLFGLAVAASAASAVFADSKDFTISTGNTITKFESGNYDYNIIYTGDSSTNARLGVPSQSPKDGFTVNSITFKAGDGTATVTPTGWNLLGYFTLNIPADSGEYTVLANETDKAIHYQLGNLTVQNADGASTATAKMELGASMLKLSGGYNQQTPKLIVKTSTTLNSTNARALWLSSWSTLSVENNSTFLINGNLYSAQEQTDAGITINVAAGSTLKATGSTILKHATITLDGTLETDGALAFENSTLTANNSIKANSTASFLNTNATIADSFTTGGATTVKASELNIAGQLNAGGATTVTNSTLNISGTFTSDGTITFDGATVDLLNDTAKISATATTGGKSQIIIKNGSTITGDGTLVMNMGGNSIDETSSVDVLKIQTGAGQTVTVLGSLRTRSNTTYNNLKVSGTLEQLVGDETVFNRAASFEAGSTFKTASNYVRIQSGTVDEAYTTLSIDAANKSFVVGSENAKIDIQRGTILLNKAQAIRDANGGLVSVSTRNDTTKAELRLNASNDFATITALKNNLDIFVADGSVLKADFAASDGGLIVLHDFVDNSVFVKNHESIADLSTIFEVYKTIGGVETKIDTIYCNNGWLSTSAVPEPAEWAAIFGAIALVAAIYRRRK